MVRELRRASSTDSVTAWKARGGRGRRTPGSVGGEGDRVVAAAGGVVGADAGHARRSPGGRGGRVGGRRAGGRWRRRSCRSCRRRRSAAPGIGRAEDGRAVPEKLDCTRTPTVPRRRAARATRRADAGLETERAGAGAGADAAFGGEVGGGRVEGGVDVRGGDRAAADVGEVAVVGLADDRVEAGRLGSRSSSQVSSASATRKTLERPGQQDRRLDHPELVHLRRADQLPVPVADRNRSRQPAGVPVRHDRGHPGVQVRRP